MSQIEAILVHFFFQSLVRRGTILHIKRAIKGCVMNALFKLVHEIALSLEATYKEM